MMYNYTTLSNATTEGIIKLYQNGTEYLNGNVFLGKVAIAGLDNLLLVSLIQLFVLLFILALLITRRW